MMFPRSPTIRTNSDSWHRTKSIWNSQYTSRLLLVVATTALLVWCTSSRSAHGLISQLDAQEAKEDPLNAAPVKDPAAIEAKVRGIQKSPEELRGLELRFEWLQYAHHISEAQHSWEIGDVADAWRHLNACRYDLRGWEHHYLFTQFTKNQRVLKTEGKVTSLAYSPDGRQIVSGYAWVV